MARYQKRRLLSERGVLVAEPEDLPSFPTVPAASHVGSNPSRLVPMKERLDQKFCLVSDQRGLSVQQSKRRE
jgi:hypothetical protein